jgi:hypothetical protein
MLFSYFWLLAPGFWLLLLEEFIQCLFDGAHADDADA